MPESHNTTCLDHCFSSVFELNRTHKCKCSCSNAQTGCIQHVLSHRSEKPSKQPWQGKKIMVLLFGGFPKNIL